MSDGELRLLSSPPADVVDDDDDDDAGDDGGASLRRRYARALRRYPLYVLRDCERVNAAATAAATAAAAAAAAQNPTNVRDVVAQTLERAQHASDVLARVDAN